MITDATHFSVHSSFSTLAFIVFVNPKGEPQSEVSWFMRMNLCACIICLRRGLNDLLLPARVSLEESDLTCSIANIYKEIRRRRKEDKTIWNSSADKQRIFFTIYPEGQKQVSRRPWEKLSRLEVNERIRLSASHSLVEKKFLFVSLPL